MCGRGRYSLQAKSRNVELSGRPLNNSSGSKLNNATFLSERNSTDNKVAISHDTVENLSPGMLCPILVSENNRISVVMMTWGLIPTYVETVLKPNHFTLFNKRIESLLKLGYFRKVAAKNRCVVILDGFYEWKTIADSKRKQPYYTSLKAKPLQIAGIFEMSKKLGENGEVISFPTFAILTGEPSEKFSVLHDREPVLLTDEQAMFWLDSNHDLDSILHELTLNPTNPDLSLSSDLQFYPVTPKMSTVQYQGSDCAEPLPKLSDTTDLGFFFNSSKQHGNSEDGGHLSSTTASGDGGEKPMSPKKRKHQALEIPDLQKSPTTQRAKDKKVKLNTIYSYFQK